jgi:hypothetical protein
MTRRSPRSLTALTAAGLALSLGPAAQGVIIINDTFEDGSPTDNPADPLDTRFTADSGASGFSVISLGGDSALQLDPSSNNTGITGDLPSTLTLSNPGDYLELTLTVQYTDTPNDQRAGLSFGFRDGTDVINDGETGISLNPGGPNGGPDTEGLFFSATKNNLSGVTPNLNFGTAAQTLTYRIELQDPTTVAYSVSGAAIDKTGNLDSDTDPLSDFGPLSFQTLFIEQSGGGNQADFTIDDVIVTTNVPEPSSLALIALGTLACATRRRSA